MWNACYQFVLCLQLSCCIRIVLILKYFDKEIIMEKFWSGSGSWTKTAWICSLCPWTINALEFLEIFKKCSLHTTYLVLYVAGLCYICVCVCVYTYIHQYHSLSHTFSRSSLPIWQLSSRQLEHSVNKLREKTLLMTHRECKREGDTMLHKWQNALAFNSICNSISSWKDVYVMETFIERFSSMT